MPRYVQTKVNCFSTLFKSVPNSLSITMKLTSLTGPLCLPQVELSCPAHHVFLFSPSLIKICIRTFVPHALREQSTPLSSFSSDHCYTGRKAERQGHFLLCGFSGGLIYRKHSGQSLRKERVMKCAALGKNLRSITLREVSQKEREGHRMMLSHSGCKKIIETKALDQSLERSIQ